MVSILNRYKILAVEDDSNDAFFIERALLAGPAVDLLLILPDGEEAVGYLEGRGAYQNRDIFPLPDLILIDLKLPGMTGLELLRWIRCHPTLNQLPVVILTGSQHGDHINRAYGLGVTGYVVKPVGMKDLTATLYGVLPIPVPTAGG